MNGLLLIILLPAALIIIFLSVWFLLIKIVSPLFKFFAERIITKIPSPVKKEDASVKTYELPLEFKGLIFFFICFSTYCVITGTHGFRGPFETYIMFFLVWAIFLFQIYKIELFEDGIVVFHRVAKNTKINADDIRSLVEGLRYYRLYHKNGTLHLDHFISNIEGFKTTLVSIRPTITIENISVKNFHKDWWGFGFLLQIILMVGVFIFVLYLIGAHFVGTIWN